MGVYDHLVELDRIQALKDAVVEASVAYVDYFFPPVSVSPEGDNDLGAKLINAVQALKKSKVNEQSSKTN